MLIKTILENQTSEKDSQESSIPTYTITYEVLKTPIKQSRQLVTHSKTEEEDEDLDDDDLVEMFTEIFSLILLKKRKKQLKLQHYDKNARLPHPNSLLGKRRKKKEKPNKTNVPQNNFTMFGKGTST